MIPFGEMNDPSPLGKWSFLWPIFHLRKNFAKKKARKLSARTQIDVPLAVSLRAWRKGSSNWSPKKGEKRKKKKKKKINKNC
jgi:hypothetical protein